MAVETINVLVTTFPGLGLPSTLCFPTPVTRSVSLLVSAIADKLPSSIVSQAILSTGSGKPFPASSSSPVSSLLPSRSKHGQILTLRLSLPLLGGKGGFGSQLRAAGGRMSSRKRRQQGENNGSNRNLDGRRLRTVTEAKALAEYLAVKPEMDRKEKEERRKRWEQVVEAADRREEEIKNGTGKNRVDGKWLEEKEEAETKTREAIAVAMSAGLLRNDAKLRPQSEESSSGSEPSSHADEGQNNDKAESGSSSKATTPPSEPEAAKEGARRVFGWDDDEDMDDSDDGEQ